MAPVMFHLTGPQPEDLPLPSHWPPGALRQQAQALVFNEYAIEAGAHP